jgi:hypothetical protein
MAFSSPNRMIWNYFDILRRLARELPKIAEETQQKQQIALMTLIGVAVVEIFVNIYFRVLVSESGFEQHLNQISKDLRARKSLDKKLKEWPTICFGKSIDWKSGAGKSFVKLKERRNKLMHFTSSHSTLDLGEIKLVGAVDTSAFDELSLADAESAVNASEDLIAEMFRLRGTAEADLAIHMQLWTGKVPS